MSRSVNYDELVDLLREKLAAGTSGLITGVSDQKHSFQIGFKDGKIVLLSYRLFKREKALDKFLQIRHAKITEHLDTEPPVRDEGLESSTVLARLTMKDQYQASGGIEGNIDLEAPTTVPSSQVQPSSTPSPQPEMGALTIDLQQVSKITAAATHLFGPIASMVCEDHLTADNLANANLHALLTRIAEEVGATEEETKSFISSAIV